MAYVTSIGTYLPCWGTRARRVPGDDEDALTLAVEAGRASLAVEAGRAALAVEADRAALA
jgi:3-hydroxy-3-methylglutaryl CoA synthase